MFQVLRGTELDAAVAKKDRGSRYVLLKLSPEPGAEPWQWLEILHHDVNGALRGFQYLAEKARASYAEGDPKAQKVLSSIERHLKTMATLKTELVDQVLPLENQ